MWKCWRKKVEVCKQGIFTPLVAVIYQLSTPPQSEKYKTQPLAQRLTVIPFNSWLLWFIYVDILHTFELMWLDETHLVLMWLDEIHLVLMWLDDTFCAYVIGRDTSCTHVTGRHTSCTRNSGICFLSLMQIIDFFSDLTESTCKFLWRN